MRIGLFGGSFDPVHQGHLMVAQTALEELKLDQLHLIPAARSPFKSEPPVASDADRLQMLRAAAAGQPKLKIDLQELERQPPSYAIDTVRQKQTAFPQAQLYYLVGEDHLETLPKWRDSSALAKAVTFAVIPRPSQNRPSPPPNYQIAYLKGIPVGISSSLIRERRQLGLPTQHLTPPFVDQIIHDKRLYL